MLQGAWGGAQGGLSVSSNSNAQEHPSLTNEGDTNNTQGLSGRMQELGRGRTGFSPTSTPPEHISCLT